MKILFGWEMGAGMGHLKSHRELFEELTRQGHELHVVSRSVGKAARAFSGLDVALWQAPFSTEKPAPHYELTPTMAQVLHNSGLDRIDEVIALCSAWDRLLEAIVPELVLVDSAPILLLSLRGRSLPVFSLSTGFFVPPDIRPLPLYSVFRDAALPPGTPHTDVVIHAALNAILAARKRPPLSHVAALYNEGVQPILTTYPELDHFPERKSGAYVGLPAAPPGETPEWPAGEGPKIYAYLKPFRALRSFLRQLQDLGWPSVIVSDGLPDAVVKEFDGGSLRFYKRGLDLNQVSRVCDLSINNANHGTLCHFLLAGIPVFLIPLTLEQQLLAARVVESGAGLSMDGTNAFDGSKLLQRLTTEATFADSARRFAARHREGMKGSHVERVLAEIRSGPPRGRAFAHPDQ